MFHLIWSWPWLKVKFEFTYRLPLCDFLFVYITFYMVTSSGKATHARNKTSQNEFFSFIFRQYDLFLPEINFIQHFYISISALHKGWTKYEGVVMFSLQILPSLIASGRPSYKCTCEQTYRMMPVNITYYNLSLSPSKSWANKVGAVARIQHIFEF